MSTMADHFLWALERQGAEDALDEALKEVAELTYRDGTTLYHTNDDIKTLVAEKVEELLEDRDDDEARERAA